MSEAISSRIRRVTPGWLIVVAAFIVILCVIVRRGGDPDIFWHIVAGQWMVDHHQVVSQDLFTFTVAGKQWIDPEYTTEIIAYLLFKARRTDARLARIRRGDIHRIRAHLAARRARDEQHGHRRRSRSVSRVSAARRSGGLAPR